MPTAVTTTVTELPESRVRVEAEVGADELSRSVQRTAKKIGRDLRIPGFRAGKVPPPVVIKRMGRQAVLDETIRGELTGWYLQAVDEAGIAPVGDPQVDLGELPAEGQPLTFSIEVGVLPLATLGTIRGVEVGRREPHVEAEAIDRELETMREHLARLEVADRPAETGDFLTLDFTGYIDGEPFAGGEGRDQLVELGAGRLLEGFEDQLIGAAAGEEREVNVRFPDDYGAESVAGKPARFAVTVKDVKAKLLPDLDDELASQLGFDTLDEAREDITERLREADEARIASEFRHAVLDAVVAEATIDIPDALVEARAQEMWNRMVATLNRQGISEDAYLKISGKSQDELRAETRPEADRALRQEAVIAAIIETEGIAPTDEEIRESLEPVAEREGTTMKKIYDSLRNARRLDEIATELAQRRALDLIAEEAKPISVEQAQARNKLWTPEKGSAGPTGEKLWTPGS